MHTPSTLWRRSRCLTSKKLSSDSARFTLRVFISYHNTGVGVKSGDVRSVAWLVRDNTAQLFANLLHLRLNISATVYFPLLRCMLYREIPIHCQLDNPPHTNTGYTSKELHR